MTKTIVLVHGAWLNSKAWEHWKPRYEARGYTVLTPDWPGDEGDPVDLKARPRKELTAYGPREIVAHFERIIRALPDSPIIIGHSAGGVFTQHLLDRGFGVAGVAIDPAPTPGVGIPLTAAISTLPVLRDPFSGNPYPGNRIPTASITRPPPSTGRTPKRLTSLPAREATAMIINVIGRNTRPVCRGESPSTCWR